MKLQIVGVSRTFESRKSAAVLALQPIDFSVKENEPKMVRIAINKNPFLKKENGMMNF